MSKRNGAKQRPSLSSATVIRWYPIHSHVLGGLSAFLAGQTIGRAFLSISPNVMYTCIPKDRAWWTCRGGFLTGLEALTIHGMPRSILSAASVAMFLRLRLRFSDTGEKCMGGDFGAQKVCFHPPPPQKALRLFHAMENASECDAICDFVGKIVSPLRCGWRWGRLRQKIAANCDCDIWCAQAEAQCSDGLLRNLAGNALSA